MMREETDQSRWPDAEGRFGPFGGQFVPELLMGAVHELEEAYAAARVDPDYWAALEGLLRDYVGRPSPLYEAKRLAAWLGSENRAGGGDGVEFEGSAGGPVRQTGPSRAVGLTGGADLTGCRSRVGRLFLKREDLNHTGSHKINNTLAQGLLAKRMGKRRIIAETGAGQHGVATATAAAVLGLECVVYMGSEDVRRQKLNAYRMELLGAKLVPVETGQRTLKDAINEALRDWMANVATTHYVIGSVMGPHPFPMMVRDFQSVIGIETREQVLAATGRLPDVVLACVGGGSNATGIFYPFIEDSSMLDVGCRMSDVKRDDSMSDVGGGHHSIRHLTSDIRHRVRLIGVEAAGEGLDRRHAATIAKGRPGVLHGMQTIVLQDDDGQTLPVHSVSAGLDYPGVGPEHAFWAQTGRVEYVSVTDAEALAAFELLSRVEGIIPALETAHAIAYLEKLTPTLEPDSITVVNLSGRGDKDCMEVSRLLNRDPHFLT